MYPQVRFSLGLLFFISGAVALIYEVVWQRLLSLNFGIGSFATATILAAFMGGLALGSIIAERFAPGLERPARVYAFLEAGVGVYALALPSLLEGLLNVYGPLESSLTLTPTIHGLLTSFLFFLLLLVPTALMGATFPVLVEAIGPSNRGGGHQLGWIYGLNCGGAVVGTLISAFVFLPELGLRQTTYVAAGLSFLVALLAFFLGEWAWQRRGMAFLLSEQSVQEGSSPGKASFSRISLHRMSLGAALTGAAAMVYELAFFRLLTLQVGSSVYAFSLMLSAFLGGLTLGSLGAWHLLRRYPTHAKQLFVMAQLFVVFAVFGISLLIPELPVLYVRLAGFLGGGALGSLAILSLSVLVLVPIALGLGASLPLAAVSVGGALTQGAARIYGANTLGAVVGTLAGGFGLLPVFGIQGTLTVGIVLGTFAIWVVGGSIGREARSRGPLIVALVLCLLSVFIKPTWQPLIMSAGIYQDLDDLAGASRERILRWVRGNARLLYYEEGLNSAVTVGVSEKTGNIWLANNGKVDASSQEDLETQLMLAHLPMAFRPHAKRVGVVGLASGITLGAVTQYPVGAIDVVELEPGIVEASHFFDAHNDRPLEDPRVSLHIMDARRYLRWERGQFDVLISEPSNPWISGVSNLFTEGFFEMAKDRLTEKGIFCQWIQLYHLSPTDLKVLVRTLHKVFPDVLVFGSLDSADLILLASKRSIAFSPSTFDEALSIPGVSESLGRLGYVASEDLLSWYLMGGESVLNWVGDGAINTDDNAWIEFRAPLFLSRETSYLNYEALLKNHEGPEVRFGEMLDGEAYLALGEAYLRRNLFHFATESGKQALSLGVEEAQLIHFRERLRTALEGYPYIDPSLP